MRARLRSLVAAMLIAGGLGASAVAARAGDVSLSADQLALATSVVQAIGIQQVADAALGGLKLVLVESLAANSKMPPEQVEPIVDQVLMPDLRATEPQFVTTVATMYAQAFTPDELQSILAFYQTPVGRKLESLQPDLSHQMVQAGHAWISQVGEAALRADTAKLAAQGLKVD